MRLSARTFLLDGHKRDRLPWMGDFVVSCLANAYSFADPFVLNGMGFPADWQTLALWK